MSSIIIILKIEVSPRRHRGLHIQTLKKVQNLRKTTPRYQKAGYVPGLINDPSLSEGWLRAWSYFM